MQVLDIIEQGYHSLKEYLKTTTDEINQKINGRPLLHFVVEKGNIPCLELLLRQSILDLDAQDDDGNTAMHVVAKSGSLEALGLLLNYGPDLLLEDNQGRKACDVCKFPMMEPLLNQRTIQASLNYDKKRRMLMSLKDTFPSTTRECQLLCLDMLTFTKELEINLKSTLKQILLEKNQLQKRNSLLEKSHINEKVLLLEKETNSQRQTISLLKQQLYESKKDLTELEKKYQLQVMEIQKQQKEQIKLVLKKAEDTEKALQSYQKLKVETEDKTKQQNMSALNDKLIQYEQTIKSLEAEIVQLKEQSNQGDMDINLLILRLIDPKDMDIQFTPAFLLVHPMILPSSDLLSKLQLQYHNNSSTLPATLKIINTIKQWIEHYWCDFNETPLLDTLKSFIDSIENSRLSQLLLAAIQRKTTNISYTIETPTDYPKPILPKSLLKKYDKSVKVSSMETYPETLKFNDLDPLEVARQLTLIEYELCKGIQAREFLNTAWMKPDKEDKAPNILKMIRWSNHVIHWIVTEIVTLSDVKQRALMFEKMIQVGSHLEKIGNFNGLKEVLAALQTSSVHRLKKTKDLISSKWMSRLEEMESVVASELNYKNLRQRIHSTQVPLIPFPGIYHSDLVALECLPGTSFNKYQKIANIILEFVSFTKESFKFSPVIEIQGFIRNAQELDDDACYNLSLNCEPRA